MDDDLLDEDERELVEWCRDWGRHPVISLLQIIDRIAPPPMDPTVTEKESKHGR